MTHMKNSSCGCRAVPPAAARSCPGVCERPAARTAGDCPQAVQCATLPVMAFVPPQTWDCAYTCGQALSRGTLFPALDKPFMGKGGCCNG